MQGIEAAGVKPAVLTFIANSLFALYLPIHWLSLHLKSSPTYKRTSTALQSVSYTGEQEGISLFPSDLACSDDTDEASGVDVAAHPSPAAPGIAPAALPVITQTSTHQLFRAACVVAPLWFFAQYFFNSSLQLTSVTSNTILSSASALFTFLFSVALLSESFTLVKLGCIGALMVGTAMVTLADAGGGGDESISGSDKNTVFGDFLCLISAVIYGGYTVAIRRMLGEDEGVAMTLFFGLMGGLIFIGVGCILGFVSFFGVLDLGTLTWRSFGMVVLKGLLDNVLSDYLWARAILLVGPTLATSGLALQLPIAVAMEGLLRNPVWLHSPGTALLTFLGGGVILAGFFALTVVSDSGGGGGSGGVGDGELNGFSGRRGGVAAWERHAAELEAELGIHDEEDDDGGGGGSNNRNNNLVHHHHQYAVGRSGQPNMMILEGDANSPHLPLPSMYGSIQGLAPLAPEQNFL